VSDAFFHAHWEGPHAELARRITTIRRYQQSHRIDVEVQVLPSAPYDGVAEVWFDDAATAAGMGEDPNYVNYAHADEPNFIDTARLAFLLGSEQWLTPSRTDTPVLVKAMLLLRRHQNCSVEEFAGRLGSLSGLSGASMHASVTVAIAESYADGAEPPFDAVAEFGYASEGELATTTELSQLVNGSLSEIIDRSSSSALVAREVRVIWPEVIGARES
jgi:uncharacterized protein (TIGR02118 family)